MARHLDLYCLPMEQRASYNFDILGYINYNGQMFVGLCSFYRKRDAITHEQNLFVKNKNLQDCPSKKDLL